MTIDEIVQKIYEERYQAPKHPEIAEMLRDGMVREIVQRALELFSGQATTRDLEELTGRTACAWTARDGICTVTYQPTTNDAEEATHFHGTIPECVAFLKGWLVATARLGGVE